MATRSWTGKYESIRREIKSKQPIYLYKDPSILSTSQPIWIDLQSNIVSDINRMKELLKLLDQAYIQKLKVSFREEDELSRDVEISSREEEIMKLLKASDIRLRKIATLNNDQKLSHQESTVRLNVIRSLTQELQHINIELRKIKQNFMCHLKEQDTVIDIILDNEPDQRQELKQVDIQNIEREREIIRVSENIQELSMMFKNLNSLIIEQGTILDRIDANLEKVNVCVDKGKDEVVKADNISKNGWSLKFILILAIIVIILITIFCIKMS